MLYIGSPASSSIPGRTTSEDDLAGDGAVEGCFLFLAVVVRLADRSGGGVGLLEPFLVLTLGPIIDKTIIKRINLWIKWLMILWKS